MKKNFFYLSIFLISFYSNYNFSQEGRFRKSLDEETKDKGIINNSFSDYKPLYSSSVFVNYNISRDSSLDN
jgi:hypothetical protein